ncbi:acyl-homoserine-lactone synthase [Chania multitudinisentens RB-25]|uniref:Acyl-homoserine-lactone synthase n=1 Tax=Chania multitudinisentens RB-25 TaxID=1441930 RepID=A0A0D4ZY24_9GAMM|nr:acyl-homoserine-lactone synthase [Chania multitudinisentens]AJW28910.1 acyl-homoserine-lactone synthase [Chania multitudinisentens RB-25]
MIEFFDLSYDSLSKKRSGELFSLRKITFKDRLNWRVSCEKNMEFDVYDNKNTTYLLGVYKDVIICSLRFIETKFPNMIIDTFKPYFKELSLPKGNYIEASRLFIDKERIKGFHLQEHPISSILFLSMVNYAKSLCYQGIYAIVSHPMLIIFQRSGWQVSVVEKGFSEKRQNIYLIHMPVDEHNQHILIKRINKKSPFLNRNLNVWPLSFSTRKNRSDELQFDPEPYGMFSIGNT